MKRLALLIILGVVAYHWSASRRASNHRFNAERHAEASIEVFGDAEFVPGEEPGAPSTWRRRIPLHKPHRTIVTVAQEGAPPAPPPSPEAPSAPVPAVPPAPPEIVP